MRTKIHCFEGEWDQNHQDITVEPLLQLLKNLDAWSNEQGGPVKTRLTYTHCLCQSADRLRRELEKLDSRRLRADNGFSCFYFAFHGSKYGLFSDGVVVPFEEIAELLDGRAKDKIIFFSSCGERGSEKQMRLFKEKTGAKMVVGYGGEADWLIASMFELWFLVS